MTPAIRKPANRRTRCLGFAAAPPIALTTALLALSAAARADPASVINALRTEGCGNEPSVGSLVEPDADLDEVARRLSRDTGLTEAIGQLGYPAASSSSFHVRGSPQDADVRRILAARYCVQINNPRYDRVGWFQRDDETWIVLAVRESLPPPLELDPVAVAERVLALVNAARSEARRCGATWHEAAPPLTLSIALNEAALVHARDMAARAAPGHEGSDGSRAGDRITRAGYIWRAAGENVAAGQRTADAAVAAWLVSPGHCATLMGPQFTDMGIAFALAPEHDPPIYWTQVFAAPR